MVERAEITQKVHYVLKEQLMLYMSTAIEDKDLLEDDLGADSIDQVEILMALEEEFSMEINEEDAAKVKTVGQAIDFLMGRLN